MPIGYYSDVVKILKKHGLELDRQSKHEVWENPETGKKMYPEKLKVTILPIVFSKQVLMISYSLIRQFLLFLTRG